MAGASYGGGIQLVTAATDPRVDAITPDIAWNSLVTSLYKAQSPKGGWSNLLFGLGIVASTVPGLAGGPDRQPRSAHRERVPVRPRRPGTISDEDVQWFASRGPGSLVDKIQHPTLLIQGTADTLFTLDEAIRNYSRPAQEPRADQDDLVLRRPRRVLDEQRPSRVRRGRRSSTGSRAT